MGAPRQEVKTGSVQSVERALDLFRAVVHAAEPVGISELSAASGLPVGTVHRLLGTLASSGYVRQEPGTRRYGVGYAAFELATRIRQNGLLTRAEPYLRELVDLTGESANLAILDGAAAMYVAHVAAPRTVRMFTEVGNRSPLHASGTGKVLLANLSDEGRESLLRGLSLQRHTPRTIVDREALRAELASVRRAGFALDNGEFEEGVSCIAVPVRDGTGEVIAAASVSGPTGRLTRERAASLGPKIRDVGSRLSASLSAGN